MILRTASLVATLSLLSGAAGRAQTSDDSLTAREIFYASVEAPVKIVRPGGARKPRTKASETSGMSSMASNTAAPTPRDSTPAPMRDSDTAEQSSAALPGGARMIKAANVNESALGLRYSILQRESGSFAEVDRDTTFHAKDSVRISVESSGDAYLYIVNQGSSGNWKVLFPSAEIQGGDNHVLKGQKYEIPQGYSFTFDEQKGDEKLFIVLSRHAEPNLEKLIYDVAPTNSKTKSKPADSDSAPKMLMASAAVNNSLISNLENVYSRDLIIEKVQDSAPPADAPEKRRETAVYTVNPVGGPNAKVVAQVTLKHR